MNWVRPFFLVSFFTGSLFSVEVRVLLAKHATETLPEVVVHGSSGFTISSFDGSISQVMSENDLHIGFLKGRLCLNGRSLAVTSFFICPQNKESGFSLGDFSYDGSLLVVLVDQQLLLINYIELEEYVYSVLRWEGWPNWPIEAKKAFAIVCRTYAMHNIFTVRNRSKAKKKVWYDIQSSTIHQTYQGRHNQCSWRSIVDETAGLVLAHNGKPIAAMYDMSCGGVIPSKMDGVDFKRYPYLQRDYACNACARWPHYSWSCSIPLADFEKQFQIHVRPGISDTRSFVSRLDAAGVLQDLTIKTRRGQHPIDAKQLYSKCSMKSLHCTVERRGKQVVISGSGYGHLLGYCQWGASYLAQDNHMTCKELLYYYYPHVTLVALKKTEGNGCARL